MLRGIAMCHLKKRVRVYENKLYNLSALLSVMLPNFRHIHMLLDFIYSFLAFKNHTFLYYSIYICNT